jgi:SAM-dependent methyltransferase
VAGVIDLTAIASALRRDHSGYWTADGASEISYPAEGNDQCFAVEEQSFWFAHRNRMILEALRTFPPAQGPLFDVGAGNGFVAAALQQAGFDTIAIEPNHAGALHAVRRGVQHVVRGELQSVGFVEQCAGGIGLFDVLEHIQADAAFLLAASRYLRPGGRLYLTVPASQTLWSQEDVYAGHFRRYSLASLRSTLESAGLTVDYATYFFSLLPLPIYLFRALRRSRAAGTAQHRAGGRVTRKLVEGVLATESAWIRRGRTIPFGASCLAVARVR